MTRKIILFVGLCLCAAFAIVMKPLLPSSKPRSSITEVDPKKLFRPTLGVTLPADITFVDDKGKAVTLGQYGRDRPYLLVPVYYRCPSLCNEVLTELFKGLDGVAGYEAGVDYEVVVVSFDPKEKPDLAAAKKAAYLEAHVWAGKEKGWHFLTGDQPQIDRMLQAINYKVQWDTGREQFAHTSAVVVCSPDGRVTRFFSGLDFRPLYLRMALTEAGEGKISAGILDQVLLPCFAFDETRGTYSAAVLTLVKAAGVLTVLLVLAFWLGMFLFRKPASSPVLVGAGAQGESLLLASSSLISAESSPRSGSKGGHEESPRSLSLSLDASGGRGEQRQPPAAS